MSKKNEASKPQEIEVSTVEMDRKLSSIEKTVHSVENIILDGLTKWSESKQQQVESEKEKNKLNDSQHKRITVIVLVLVAVLFILSMTALLLGEYELVKWILTSSFALGAGAGITSFIKKK